MTCFTLQYGSTEKTLADWGIAHARREANNQAGDSFAFDLIAPADAADPFPFGAKIIVRIGRSCQTNAAGFPLPAQSSFSGGRVFFVGWRVDSVRMASAALESLRCKFAGPWDYFLERLVFQKLFLTWNGSQQVADYRSQVVLGQSLTVLTGPADTIPGTVATSLMSVAQQLREIAAYAVNQTTAEFGAPQFQFDPLAMDSAGSYILNASPGALCQIPDYVPGLGTGSAGNGLASGQTAVPLRAPLDAVNDITCAEAIRKMLRWIGGVGSPVAWFDYTLDPPALKISTRDQLPSSSLPCFSKSLRISRRDDLIPTAVDLKFRVTSQNNGHAVVQIFHDIACPAGATNEATGATDSSLLPYGRKFGAQIATIDFEGPKITSAKCVIACIPLNLSNPSADTAAQACWQAIFPELTAVSNLAGNYTSITDPDSGAAIDLSPFSYILRDPGAAPWMFDGSTAAISQRVVVKAKFSYTEGSGAAAPGSVDYHEKTAHLTLTNLPGGTYYSAPSVTAAEPVPFGLASFIYNIEKIPQYQGAFTLQETEVTDPSPIGANLNLVGAPGPGALEWAAMNACVQRIAYVLDAAATTFTFGPAAHLGAQDLAERLRVNVNPRFLYLIGANQLNQAAAAQNLEIPSHTPQTGRSSGVENHPYKLFAAHANDVFSLSSLYPHGFPGISIDTRSSTQLPATNNIASTPTPTASNPTPVDNTGLTAPTGPCIFLAAQGNDAGVLGNFVRIAVSDIAPDPTDGLYRRGAWFQKLYTGEDCTNKSFRWVLCSPLYRDP